MWRYLRTEDFGDSWERNGRVSYCALCGPAKRPTGVGQRHLSVPAVGTPCVYDVPRRWGLSIGDYWGHGSMFSGTLLAALFAKFNVYGYVTYRFQDQNLFKLRDFTMH